MLTRSLQGEAREVARDLLARARALPGPACLIAGGETTVTVRGQGQGGRCQEFALAAALELAAGDDAIVLAAGTDGTDGPTDAAGGLVDAGTVARARKAGRDAGRGPRRQRRPPRSSRPTDDAVVTGPTNTNLLDLYLILRP